MQRQGLSEAVHRHLGEQPRLIQCFSVLGVLSADEQRVKVFSGWLCKVCREAFVCGVVCAGIKAFGGQELLQKASERRLLLLLLCPTPGGAQQRNTGFSAIVECVLSYNTVGLC